MLVLDVFLKNEMLVVCLPFQYGVGRASGTSYRSIVFSFLNENKAHNAPKSSLLSIILVRRLAPAQMYLQSSILVAANLPCRNVKITEIFPENEKFLQPKREQSPCCICV